MFEEDIALVKKFLNAYFEHLIALAKGEQPDIGPLEHICEDINQHGKKAKDIQLFDRFNLLFYQLTKGLEDVDLTQKHWKWFIERGSDNTAPWNNLNLYLSLKDPQLTYYSEQLFALFNSLMSNINAHMDFDKVIEDEHLQFLKKEFGNILNHFLSRLT